MSHTVIGFAGHRHLKDPDGTRALIAGALDRLAGSHPSLVALSSVAIGADQLFADEALRRRLPFLAVLPFPATRFRQDFAPADWAAAERLLAAATHVDAVDPADSGDGAYMEAGVRVVDLADIVMVVWDGEPGSGPGGTSDVVAYARALERPLLWINPVTGALVPERMEPAPPSPSDTDGLGPRATVERWFETLDASANRDAPTVRHLLQRVVVLHLVASVAGLAVLALDLEGIIAWGVAAFEVLVLLLAFWLSARRHHSHAHWLRNRIEAEICRSALATWAIRDHMRMLAVPGYDRLARQLRVLQRLDRTAAPPFEVARSDYLEHRVRHQVGYFGQRATTARGAYRNLTRLAMTCTVLAMLMAGAHLVLAVRHVEGLVTSITEFLSLSLPLASAAIFSLVLTQEYSRRASRYREMVAWLDWEAYRLAAARTWVGLAGTAAEVETALLNEAVEWQGFRRAASDPH